MKNPSYRIVDDFQVLDTDVRVLVLDRPYEFHNSEAVTIDGESYRFSLNSIREWVIIHSKKSFKGKTAVFC